MVYIPSLTSVSRIFPTVTETDGSSTAGTSSVVGLSTLPVAIEAWGPLVFVNPDPDAGPLADVLGPIEAKVALSGLDLDRLRFRVRNDWEIECDWKVAIENYLECYHCAVTHPGFSKVLDVGADEYLYEADGLSLMQFAHVREKAGIEQK